MASAEPRDRVADNNLERGEPRACEICEEPTGAPRAPDQYEGGSATVPPSLPGLCERCRGYLFAPVMKELVRARVEEDRRRHPGPVVRLAEMDLAGRNSQLNVLLRAAWDRKWNERKLDFDRAIDPDRYRADLLHLAAMTLAVVEAGDLRARKGEAP